MPSPFIHRTAFPLLVFFGFFPAKYSGLTVEEVMYDPEKLWEAEWKTLTDFPMDMAHNPLSLTVSRASSGNSRFQTVEMARTRTLAPHLTYQFVEGEYMKADEYDHFLLDPTDFMIRRYWPRIYGALKGFEKLPPLHSFITYYMGTPHGLCPLRLS